MRALWLIVVFPLFVVACEPNHAPPPRGGYFRLKPPGSFPRLPGDGAAARTVHRSTWEPRGINRTPNHNVPPSTFRAGCNPTCRFGYSGMAHAAALFGRVTGNFSGTTDEIIQWAAVKWGLPDEVIRAEAVAESYWYQAKDRDHGYGDYGSCSNTSPKGSGGPTSFGLLQVKWCAHRDASSSYAWDGWPYSETSTPWNLDYFGAVIRGCYEGWDYFRPYPSGDLYGCVGRWFSGEWHTSGGDAYAASVKRNFADKAWLRAGF